MVQRNEELLFVKLAGPCVFSKAQGQCGKAFEALMKEGLSGARQDTGIPGKNVETNGCMSKMVRAIQTQTYPRQDKLKTILKIGSQRD